MRSAKASADASGNAQVGGRGFAIRVASVSGATALSYPLQATLDSNPGAVQQILDSKAHPFRWRETLDLSGLVANGLFAYLVAETEEEARLLAGS